MSGPTKGMVAGQPIKTGAATKEFDEGYERIFGPDRKPVRGRWRYDAAQGKCVDIDAEWNDAEARAQTTTEGLVYGHERAPDGTDISGRAKHRDYMKRNGLAMVGDFTEHWAKAEKERARVLSGDADSKATKETIGRELHKLDYSARRKVMEQAVRDAKANRKAEGGWIGGDE